MRIEDDYRSVPVEKLSDDVLEHLSNMQEEINKILSRINEIEIKKDLPDRTTNEKGEN